MNSTLERSGRATGLHPKAPAAVPAEAVPAEARTWLGTLRAELAARKVRGRDAEEAVSFYAEAILDRLEAGLAPAEAIAELGVPADAAGRIVEDVPVLERARRKWPSWLFGTLVALLLMTAILWVPLVLTAFLLIAAFVAAFVMVDGAFVAALPLAVAEFAKAVSNGSVLSTSFLHLSAGVAFAGLGLLFAPVAVRVVEFAARAFWRGFERLVGLVRRVPPTGRGAWYGSATTLRRFDRACLVAGGVLLAFALVAIVALMAAHGWDVASFPGLERFDEIFSWGDGWGMQVDEGRP